MALRLQRAILPESFPGSRSWQVAAHYRRGALATVVAMIVVLSVLLAVAVLAAVLLAIAGRKSATALADERRRHQELAGRVEESAAGTRRAVERAAAAESRVRGAEQRAAVAERRAGEAEHRAESAERREAVQQARADRLEREAAEREAAAGAGSGTSVWPLERLRARREWMEVVGPGVDLPAPWDETVGSIVAGELAVIREVMGTPGEMRRLAPGAVADRGRAAAVVRATVELMRAAARAGTRMDVTVSAAEVAVALEPGSEAPVELAEAAEAAVEAGLQVTADPGGEGRGPEVRLGL